jgi:hypothetical protein
VYMIELYVECHINVNEMETYEVVFEWLEQSCWTFALDKRVIRDLGELESL